MSTVNTPPSTLQALAFDIDRTLTPRSKNITAYTQKVLQQIIESNRFYVFLCSGRPWAQATDILKLFPDETMHVTSGGASIVNSRCEVLQESTIPSELVREIALKADALGVEMEIDIQGKRYANERKRAKRNRFLPLSELQDWSTTLLCLQWINDDVRNLVKQYEGIEIKEMKSEFNGPYMDITRQGVNKASGLQVWSKLTGIDLANVAGFGDSQNDQEFISAVGWKVAMGNAVPQLKAIADVVIGDCDDDGLAKYIAQTWL